MAHGVRGAAHGTVEAMRNGQKQAQVKKTAAVASGRKESSIWQMCWQPTVRCSEVCCSHWSVTDHAAGTDHAIKTTR